MGAILGLIGAARGPGGYVVLVAIVGLGLWVWHLRADRDRQIERRVHAEATAQACVSANEEHARRAAEQNAAVRTLQERAAQAQRAAKAEIERVRAIHRERDSANAELRRRQAAPGADGCDGAWQQIEEVVRGRAKR